MHYLLVLSFVFALSVQEHTTFQQKRQQNGGGRIELESIHESNALCNLIRF